MRFDIECPHCNYKMQAAPSLFQMSGMLDYGHGTCHECDKLFGLTLVDEAQKPRAMEARIVAEGIKGR